MIQINCIFINLKQQECRALDKLYCVSEDKCSFCKLNNERLRKNAQRLITYM